MNDNIVVKGGGILFCRNPDGSIAWRRTFKNAPTLVGLDYFAAVGFTGGSQVSQWYAGLIDLTGFLTLNTADTMGSHLGWQEITAYSGTRAAWVNTEGGQQVSSNGNFSFTMTGNGTIHGLFICSLPTAGGNSGVLWATAVLPTDAKYTIGQVITGTYSVALSGG